MSGYLHQHTPSLAVIDPRGLFVRTVAYHRVNADDAMTEQINRHVLNANGQPTEQWDPRLSARTSTASSPNQYTRFNLSGQPLSTDSVDAGWRVACYDAAGLMVDTWDGRGIHHRYQHDEQMRPLAVFERLHEDSPEHCIERFTYGDNCPHSILNNACGQLTRHDDPAGSLWHEVFGMSGQPLTETRRFCQSLAPPNWPDTDAEREGLLEVKRYTTHWRYDALGEVVGQTDALGHVQRLAVDVAGQLSASCLDGVVLLKSARYNVFGQVEAEHAGNDVMTTAEYSHKSGQLYRLKTRTGTGKVLQDVHYQYDAVGNIERVEDAAQPVQWFARQRIEAVNTYTYDTLYQLTRATGRENASQTIGPGLPGLEIFGAADDSRWRNYTQTYTYDSGGNLTRLKHDADTANTYKRDMVVDTLSNRSLLKNGSPIDFAKEFDASGNQQALSPGQVMRWDGRNQLRQVIQVQRDEPDGQDDDVEIYVYDGGGLRVRKVRRAKTRGGEQISEVRYLPGLEIRTHAQGETLQVVIAQAGSNGVRMLHWEARLPKNIDNNQLRYTLADHVGSSMLEVDQNANVITQESYYPYGGTSWWAARNTLEAKYKTIRYSGEERDATGLYYYGFRYYAPWLQRWINPDPAGAIEGLNVYRMVGNNPVSSFDLNGNGRQEAIARWKKAYGELQRRNTPVRVSTLVPGIINVRIDGGSELFNQIGIPLPRAANADRSLSYLSIDSTYKSKISGGDNTITLKRNPLGSISADKTLRKSSDIAYINGSFFNMNDDVDPRAREHASIGKNIIDKKEKAHVPIPLTYRDDYKKLSMDDGSMIYSGPALSENGVETFTAKDLKKSRFNYSKNTCFPGDLGHASEPNNRAGISSPGSQHQNARTRLVIGLAEGRDADSPGYTMPEWATVMARMDRLNANANARSINLDGGGSTALGVVSSSQGVLMAQGATHNPNRSIGNFIAFYKPNASSQKSWLSRLCK